MELSFDVSMETQPTEVTCGATCLACIYRYLNLPIDFNKMVDEVPQLDQGGTLGVYLGQDALARGLEVTIYTHNLQVFDPSWFELSSGEMIDKLALQAQVKGHLKTVEASLGYKRFLEMGGVIRWHETDENFVYELLRDSGPIIVGLSATYLYWSKREYGENCDYDDIRGEPQGHFVVVCGVSGDRQSVMIADPHKNNPIGDSQKYSVSMTRLINSTLLGAITYDANFIQIKKRK